MTYMLDTNICIYVMKEKTGECAAAISRGNGWRNLHFFHYTGGAGVWNET